MGEVKGGSRKQDIKEHCNLYCSPNIIRVTKSKTVRWAGHVACTEDKKVYKILVGKFEGKRPFRRPRCRWEDAIKMELKEISWKFAD
jgi:hypothetical protein